MGCAAAGRRGETALRPTLKTEAELAAERETRIRAGEIVPTGTPPLEAAAPAGEPAEPAAPPLVPTPGAIQPDILMVNDAVLTVAEILYPLRGKIEEARRAQTRRGLREQVMRWVRSQTQQEIGSLLVYQQAMSKLQDQQKEQLEKTVKRELDERITVEFGGSPARLEAHLAEHNLTLEQYKAKLRRDIVVYQYNRETFLPQIHVRRDELLDYYHRNISKYSSAETRELLLIEAPFEKFLPAGLSWEAAAPAAKAQAKLQAVRHIRAAHAALGEKSFEEAAREFSRGPHAEDGGSWGAIGSPLQPPYEEASRKIFEFQTGQCSEPLETSKGWCIVKCGQIAAAQQKSFADAQEEIRETLKNKRFNEVAADYVMRLAEKATITSPDGFINAALQRVGLPAAPPTARGRP